MAGKHQGAAGAGGFTEQQVKKAIQQLTLQQYITGAANVKAQVDAAVKTVDSGQSKGGGSAKANNKLNKRDAKANLKQ